MIIVTIVVVESMIQIIVMDMMHFFIPVDIIVDQRTHAFVVVNMLAMYFNARNANVVGVQNVSIDMR